MVKRRNKGYSMIELILTIAITGIVATSIYSLMSFGERLFLRSEDEMMLTEQLGAVLTEVSSAVREAEEIESSETGIPLDEEIIYSIIGSGGAVVMSVTYDRNSSLLTIAKDAASKTVENISGFRIDISNPRIAEISIEGRTRYADEEFSVTAALRNHDKFVD